MSFVINTCNFATILHRKLGPVFRGFSGALKYLLKFVVTIISLFKASITQSWYKLFSTEVVVDYWAECDFHFKLIQNNQTLLAGNVYDCNATKRLTILAKRKYYCSKAKRKDNKVLALNVELIRI